MRLSEAILLGAGTAELSPFSLHNGEGKACALGLAENAIGRPTMHSINHSHEAEVARAWPWLLRARLLECPFCEKGYAHSNAFRHIAHLFDLHVFLDKQWTLEQLVDYVRSIEPQDAAGSLDQPQELQAVAPDGERAPKEVL